MKYIYASNQKSWGNWWLTTFVNPPYKFLLLPLYTLLRQLYISISFLFLCWTLSKVSCIWSFEGNLIYNSLIIVVFSFLCLPLFSVFWCFCFLGESSLILRFDILASIVCCTILCCPLTWGCFCWEVLSWLPMTLLCYPLFWIAMEISQKIELVMPIFSWNWVGNVRGTVIIFVKIMIISTKKKLFCVKDDDC